MIRYYCQDIRFNYTNKRITNLWLRDIANRENKKIKDLCIIFCSDQYLLHINNEFLSHNYYTDIITFDYCNTQHCRQDQVSGDLFISIDTVKANAEAYFCTFEEELHRVIAHGLLHLLGYNDYTKDEQIVMRNQEDISLERRHFFEKMSTQKVL